MAVEDIVDAVLYLSQAGQVTGEVRHFDGPEMSRDGEPGKPRVVREAGACAWKIRR